MKYKLKIQPYLDNALDHWRQNIPKNPESYDEHGWDRDFLEWVCPKYHCTIRTRKKDGFALWFEFDNESDATMFALKWA